MYPYLDDIFHVQASPLQVCLTHDVSLRLHFTLGFGINLKKSVLVPTQVLLHLGGMINTRRGFIYPPPARVDALVVDAS